MVHNGKTDAIARIIMILMFSFCLFMSLSVTSVIQLEPDNVSIAYADSGAKIDDNYADTFLKGDDNTNGTWYENIIEDVPGYKYKGETWTGENIQSVTDSLWSSLRNIVMLVLGFTILFFVVKIVGRAAWILVLSNSTSATLPKFFMSSRERKPANKTNFTDATDSGFRYLFVDFLVGFGIALGACAIFALISSIVLFMMGYVPDELSSFNAFNLQS